MTLQDLIDSLNTLHPSATTATVMVRTETADLEILSISYVSGEVIIQCIEYEEPE